MPTPAATDLAPADYNGRCAILADQIVAATSCDPEAARLGAGAFLSFPGDRQFGLGDPPSGWVLRYIAAGYALSCWLKAKASQAAPVALVQRRAA